MEERLIWGTGGFITGVTLGYLLALALNKFKWQIRTFVIIVGTMLWGFIMIARVLNPSLNIGVIFDLIMGGIIGNAVGFNFGGLLKTNITGGDNEKDTKQN